MTQGPAAGKPFYYGGKDCNFSELFFSDQAPAKKVTKYNTNRRELGRMAFSNSISFISEVNALFKKYTCSLLIILSWFAINLSLMSVG